MKLKFIVNLSQKRSFTRDFAELSELKNKE